MIKKSVPVGVKILSILSYIVFAIGFFGGISFLIGGKGFFGVSPQSGDPIGDAFGAGLANIFGQMMIVFGIIFILMGILGFFIGRGLWKGQNWARITTIVLSCLFILGNIKSIFDGENFGQQIGGIIILALIIAYLTLSQKVKKAFN